MTYKDTVAQMKRLLSDLMRDLDKGLLGNKAASQRARVNTVKLEKLSRAYRKQSLPLKKVKEGGKV